MGRRLITVERSGWLPWNHLRHGGQLTDPSRGRCYMSKPERPSREDVFLYVYHRAVRKVVDSATELVKQLNADPRASYAMDAERSGDSVSCPNLDWHHVVPAIQELNEINRDNLVTELHSDIIERILEANQVAEAELCRTGFRDANTRLLAEVVDVLEQCIQELGEMCHRWAVAVFGDWGAHWFRIAAFGDFHRDHVDEFSLIRLSPAEILTRLDKPDKSQVEQGWEDATDARDRWIYEQVMTGVKYEQIIIELRSKPVKWQRIGSKQGIRLNADRYAKKFSRPAPMLRRPGRPTAGS